MTGVTLMTLLSAIAGDCQAMRETAEGKVHALSPEGYNAGKNQDVLTCAWQALGRAQKTTSHLAAATGSLDGPTGAGWAVLEGPDSTGKA